MYVFMGLFVVGNMVFFFRCISCYLPGSHTLVMRILKLLRKRSVCVLTRSWNCS